MTYEKQPGVPRFEAQEYGAKSKDFVLLIPIINEGNRIHQELQLRQLKITGANIIYWAFAFLLLNIQSEFFKDFHLCINCSSVRTDPIFLIQNRA